MCWKSASRAIPDGGHDLALTIDPRYYDAVVFHLDGVVTDTAAIDAAAWTQFFDDYLARRPPRDGEDHSPFTDDDYRRFVAGKACCDAITDFLISRGIALPVGADSDSTDDTELLCRSNEGGCAGRCAAQHFAPLGAEF
jgi:hypothetical protein